MQRLCKIEINNAYKYTCSFSIVKVGKKKHFAISLLSINTNFIDGLNNKPIALSRVISSKKLYRINILDFHFIHINVTVKYSLTYR